MLEELNSRMAAAETRVCKAVFPNTTNHYDTLFGGTALQWMDEVAFICATRFSRARVVTVSSDRVDFHRPIPSGSIVELVATVKRIGRSSMQIQVDIFREEMFNALREQVITGSFTFVAVDENKKPIPLID
jgi:acyl-CoA hydrolase